MSEHFEAVRRSQPVSPEWEVCRPIKFGSETIALCWDREWAELFAELLEKNKFRVNSLARKLDRD